MQLKKLMYVLPFCGVLMTAASFAAQADEKASNPKDSAATSLPCKILANPVTDPDSCVNWALNNLQKGQAVMCRQGNAKPWAGPIVFSLRSFEGQLCKKDTPIIGGMAKKFRALIAAFCMPEDEVGFNASASCGTPLKTEFGEKLLDPKNDQNVYNEIFANGKTSKTAIVACTLSKIGLFKGEAAQVMKDKCNAQ